jgi:YhcH/YjgK/YiaL family protein
VVSCEWSIANGEAGDATTSLQLLKTFFYKIQTKSMIIDALANAERYIHLHPFFAKAFEFINQQNLQEIAVGKYPIDGDNLHASVSEKPGTGKAEAKFEAHDHCIDIQVCISGLETMGWKPRNNCVNIKTPYNSEKDVTFFDDKPDTYFDLHEMQFAIFYPGDVHAPMIGDDVIKKMVVKVKL